MAGIEMGDQHERHTAAGRHIAKEKLKASRPPAEAPMPMIGKPVSFSWFLFDAGETTAFATPPFFTAGLTALLAALPAVAPGFLILPFASPGLILL